MSTPEENAMHWTVKSALKRDNPKEYKKKFYSNGIPRVEGKSFKQFKSDQKASYKPEIMHYKTNTSHAPPPKKDRWGWAGRVGQAHLRNQKAEHEKGYREDYR